MKKIYFLKNILKKLRYGNVINNKINIYKRKNLMKFGKKKNVNVILKNILLFCIILIIFLYIYFSNYSMKSLYIGIFILLGLILYLLIIDRIKRKKEIESEIENIKKMQLREQNNFLDKIKKIEELERNQISEIILKNEEGYDIYKWKIGRNTSFLIGKETGRNKVDVDVTRENFSNLVSRVHGSLNRVNGIWYYEDLGSQNGSGIEKKKDKRKVRIGKYEPIKVESGDIIYLPITKLLLK